jgi:periplasmic protein TonB
MAENSNPKRFIPVLIGVLILAGIVALIVHLVGKMESRPEKKERKIQTVTLAPPPPPPPPPKIEKPPEPEPEQKLEEQAEPEPEKLPDVPDEAPPRDLGLDAEGTAGSDGFGLAARKGGTGLFGGGSGNPFAWYGNLVKNDLVALLSEKDDLRRKGYTAILKLWVEADGSIKRFELARGSNDKDIDELLHQMIGRYQKIQEPPPPGLQQPIKLKICSNL